MKKYSVLLVLLLTCSGQAGTYQIVYQERIDGAEGYADISAVIRSPGVLDAFVYSDSASHRILIDYLDSDSLVTWTIGSPPVSTVSAFSEDSLTIYCLARAVYRLVWSQGSLSVDSVPLYEMPEQERWTIRLDDLGRFGPSVVIRGRARIDLLDVTIGYGYDYRGTCEIFDRTIVGSARAWLLADIQYGNLYGDETSEYVAVDWSHGAYYYNDPWDPPPSFWNYVEVKVAVSLGSTLAIDRTNGGLPGGVFVDRFIPASDYDALICYGQLDDLNNQHVPCTWHAACYSFASGEPEEIWYTPLSGVTPEHVYKPQHYVAGMRGANKVIALNYWNGQLCDSIDLDRHLTATAFFETGSDPSVLNLVGRSYDTIFVYQFETPTEVENDEESILPLSFELAQNYPNPFNDETVMRISNNTRQHLTLKVYNILGQEVTVLHDAETSAGTFAARWNGADHRGRQVASGVYFARLASPVESSLIKMVLLR